MREDARLITDNNVALLEVFSQKWDIRNVDKSRMTSLSWAAAEGRLQVFEWLLWDCGHDDQELSRVSCGRQEHFRALVKLTSRTMKTIRSFIYWPHYLPLPPPLHDIRSCHLSVSIDRRKRYSRSQSEWPMLI